MLVIFERSVSVPREIIKLSRHIHCLRYSIFLIRATKHVLSRRKTIGFGLLFLLDLVLCEKSSIMIFRSTLYLRRSFLNKENSSIYTFTKLVYFLGILKITISWCISRQTFDWQRLILLFMQVPVLPTFLFLSLTLSLDCWVLVDGIVILTPNGGFNWDVKMIINLIKQCTKFNRVSGWVIRRANYSLCS